MQKSLKQQDISKKEKVFLAGKSAAVIILLNCCFYREPAACLPLAVLGSLFYGMEKRELLRRKREEVRQQFKEWLLLSAAGQRAGYSPENSLLESCRDMEKLYGKNSGICRMLFYVRTGLSNNISICRLWKTIGEESGIEEIEEFAQVFAIARESSGNFTEIMERTAEAIKSRAETQKEIEMLICERKLEQKIMNVMPFFIMIYISITSPGYFQGLYHTLTGTVIMTVCLLLYLTAYVMGGKMTEIEV